MKSNFIPPGLVGKALYNYLTKNEALILHAKKSQIKRADSVYAPPLYVNAKGELASKTEVSETQIDPTKLQATVVINTTNWLDSHQDVHIPGIWKKSLADNKSTGFYLLQSHGYDFPSVITDGCSGFTKNLSWKDLDQDIPGTTEALIFKGIIDQSRNEYMFDQYQKGYVKNHSVGMRYIKLVTCINDDDYPVQKENWDKYIEMVANRDEAEADGYFWAILEAQIIEGSAVLFGSNCMTPTLETSLLGTKSEPLYSTLDEPPLTLDDIRKTKFI
jgi:hypothetical protein